MRWRDFRTLIYFIIAAIVFGIISWVILPPAVAWIALVVVWGLILIGLVVNSLLLLRDTDKKIKEINESLQNIVQIQEAMQKEQKEQAGSRSTVVPTLQAVSQFYMDYFARQKGKEEEQQKNTNEV